MDSRIVYASILYLGVPLWLKNSLPIIDVPGGLCPHERLPYLPCTNGLMEAAIEEQFVELGLRALHRCEIWNPSEFRNLTMLSLDGS